MRSFGLVVFICTVITAFLVVPVANAQSNGKLHSTDMSAMSSALRGMVDDAKGREKDWKGPNGSGVIRVTTAFSSTQGVACTSIASCDKPCRKYEYTFIGKRTDRAIINLTRSAQICHVEGKWKRKANEKTVNETILTPAPPKVVVPKGPTPAELARIKAEEDRRREEAAKKAEQDRIAREKRAAEAQKQAKMRSAAAARKLALMQVQAKLKTLYYDVGTPDGTLGLKTRKALENYLVDERSTVSLERDPSTEKLEQITDLLDTTINRQSFSSKCTKGVSTGFVACGFVSK